jgi:NAD(P)H dehydrogenase (quinone)
LSAAIWGLQNDNRFWKLGYKNRQWINLSRMKMVSQAKREKWLAKLGKRFEQLQ